MIDRRTFCAAVAALLLPMRSRADDAAGALRFGQDGKSFRFNTGALRGTIHKDGKSMGLNPLLDAADNPLATSMGIFSHYRLLDADARYGPAAWDWSSLAKIRDDGSLQVNWAADEIHPFDLQAIYRWSAPDTLDLVTTVTAKKDLKRFEVFLASYFNGFPQSFVYAKPGRFIEAKEADGVWHMFPRDEEAVKINKDGRWNREPNPVDWTVRPAFAAPLAIRRDARTGLAAVIMAPPDDCFAVLTPHSEEPHRSLYLSLLGQDIKANAAPTARARLVIRKDISDPQAVELYEAYMAELKRESP